CGRFRSGSSYTIGRVRLERILSALEHGCLSRPIRNFSLKGGMCSLLGHDYGEPDVERERNEEGTEVVVTAKRIERCRNCGRERTITENTEVTALSAAAGVVREPDGTVVVASDDAATADNSVTA